ncbi:MarR family winged helix-turn-helix transcriptional regulator [Actinoplanes awajinensis]|uniref:MarR family transcriptional regulator n=1 Tax=Actinoplanes awajinensis subsp. mycoplanecinus TaxID=135947 RepID=A0A0X3VD53_9ACTN|nr:MarR family transcriptional regulator [Actinoplanes awajinensis]KUL42534.1 MarR family transcriptional regulator [Actinoplanes awajinensis subsp. mycoplanecinus]
MRGPTDLLYLLTRAERLLARRLSAILDAEDCSLDAWRVIALLADGKGRFMTELSERAFLPPGSLTRLVDHLVEDNLVYRRGDDLDRRRIKVHLTARGRRLFQRVDERIRAELTDVPLGDSLGALVEALECSPGHTLAARQSR